VLRHHADVHRVVVEEKKRPRKAISSNVTITRFSPESVAALAAANQILSLRGSSRDGVTPFQALMMTDVFKSGMSISLRPGLEFPWPKQPFLTNWVEEDSGSQGVGAFDPFSSLPSSVVSEPIQMVLIQYCKLRNRILS
jgi:hypothetical protein